MGQIKAQIKPVWLFKWGLLCTCILYIILKLSYIVLEGLLIKFESREEQDAGILLLWDLKCSTGRRYTAEKMCP